MAKASADNRTEISAGSTVRGRFHGAEDVNVAGRIEGSVQLAGNLNVLRGGVVKANVTAEKVTIAGILVGDVSASVSVELGPEARVLGDIHSPTLKIAEGARYAGNLDVGEVEASLLEARRVPRVVPVEEPEELAELEAYVEAEPRSTPLPGLAALRTAQDVRRRKIVVKKRS